MSILIREGKKSDIPAVLQLIRELAKYEKAPEEVEITADQMGEWGFGKQPLFKFFVADIGSQLIGLALYYYKYSTWKGKCIFLEDIIVTESHRRMRVGSRLFDEVVKVAKQEGVKRLEWQVLNWNEPAIGFYKKYMTQFDETWINCRLTYPQIQSR